MAVVGEFITAQMASGRVVRARLVELGNQTRHLPLVSWGGLKPFPAMPLTQAEVLALEQNPLQEETR